MRIISDGRSWPPHRLVRRWRQFWFDRRDALACEVEIRDGGETHRFRCAGMLELSRCMGLFTKESGTCEWIQGEVRPGEVFYDIGANIGLYTILAGKRIGPHGKVYGFEPHGPNFARLLDNIALNGLQDVVTPCSVALHDRPGFFSFNYVSSEPGSADSQLATTRRSAETDYRPEIAELKYAASIDALISDGVLQPPHHVKLDVDGNELFILRGMTCLLRSADRPRSIQVEINKRHKDEIVPFMTEHGYELANRHYTRSGQKRIARGEDPEGYAYNAIFRPMTGNGSEALRKAPAIDIEAQA
jgi:FkbM family methyltransferase